MKIYQSAFVWDLVIEEKLTNYNANVIPIKVGLSIKMTNLENYNETNFHTFKRFVGKLM